MLQVERRLVESAENFVKNYFEGAEPGHDRLHTERVKNLALVLARQEGWDENPNLLELVALLHDIGDHKFRVTNAPEEDPFVIFLAAQVELDEAARSEIIKMVGQIAYSKQQQAEKLPSMIVRIVRDADRLDAIGAIGVARAFSYGGFRIRPFYEDEISGQVDGNTLQHFTDKLLKLKDLFHTESARKLAQSRHEFLELFYQQFETERQYAAGARNAQS